MRHTIFRLILLLRVFSVKISPLGPNFRLLEELDGGILEELISDRSSWWKQWFRYVRPWQISDVDSERDLLTKVFGVSCQSWYMDFFISLANNLGKYICVDENTM